MKTIDQDIKTGEIKQMYLLYGPEDYLIRQYRDKLKKALVNDGDTMNFNSFHGSDINQNEIIDLAETMPFFADRRLILIEDSELFSKAAEELAEYLASVPESTYFIFVEKDIVKTTKMYRDVKKYGRVVEFGRQKDDLLMRWITGRLKQNNKSITREAFDLFIKKTGNDMETINSEMEKLICYALDREVIDVSDVESITTEQIEDKIFDMIEAVTMGQQKKAFDLYYDLIALKEAPFKILILLANQFSQIMLVKSMVGHGFANKDISENLSCPLWLVKKYINQGRRYSLEELKQALSRGVELDAAIKAGHLTDRMAVELYISECTKKTHPE